MSEVRWAAYPTVAQSETARAWLQIQAHLCLAPNTVEAYGRSLEDYPVEVHVDGDCVMETPITCRVAEETVSILVPRSPGSAPG